MVLDEPHDFFLQFNVKLFLDNNIVRVADVLKKQYACT
jgi:hypothetical protein